MDRKSILILAFCFVLFLSWSLLINRLYPPIPVPVSTNTIAAVTNGIPAGATNPAIPAPAVLSAASGIPLEVQGEETLLTVENDLTKFMVTSHRGGLKEIELKKYMEAVGCGTRKKGATNEAASLNSHANVAAFTLLGSAELQGDGNFAVTRIADGVRAEKPLPLGLHLVKEFRPGTNYLLGVTLRLENRTNHPIRVPDQEWVMGTATPITLHDDPSLMSVSWFDGSRLQSVNELWYANRTLGCVPGTPRKEYLAGSNNVFWAAVQNRFFTLIAIPPTNSPAPQLLARRVSLRPPDAVELAEDPKAKTNQIGYQTAFLYPAAELAPGQSLERRFNVFAGPKEYQTLDRLAAQFKNRVDLVMGFGGFFGYFSKMLLLSMNWLNALGLPYALAIIVITVIIKMVFWPLTQASTRSMKRMGALQPQMKAIQEKYKDDPRKMQQKLHEFWKEHKINPAAGCLPIFIQIPVFIGFYKMLQSAIELRGAQFLWACDLSQPDTVFIVPGLSFIPFLGIPGAGLPLNPLPLIMGATQIWQMRLTPPSPGMDPVQQKIMQYMPLMFIFILYNFSSGLTLYWTVQNLLTIAQMKLTRATEAKAAAQSSTPKPPAPSPKKNR
jgi:YidC/Oxa1 family membrane protein insertase